MVDMDIGLKNSFHIGLMGFFFLSFFLQEKFLYPFALERAKYLPSRRLSDL